MTSFHRSALARVGAVALLAAGGLATVAAPAQAADQADLALVPLSQNLARGVEAAKAKPFKFTVDNTRSSVAASDVRVTVETKGLTKRVGFVVPDGCRRHRHRLHLPARRPGRRHQRGLRHPAVHHRWSGQGRHAEGDHRARPPPTPTRATTGRAVDITVTQPGYDLTILGAGRYAERRGRRRAERRARPEAGSARRDRPAGLGDLQRRQPQGHRHLLRASPCRPGSASRSCRRTASSRRPTAPAQAFCEDAGAVIRPGEYYTATSGEGGRRRRPSRCCAIGELFAYGLDEAAGRSRGGAAGRLGGPA